MALSTATGRAGFVVLESPHFAVDWGGVDLRGLSTARAVEKIITKVAWYLPDVLILEDPKAKGCRKGAYSRAVIRRIEKQAGLRAIEVRFIARLVARRFFPVAGTVNKDKIAQAVLQELPELRRPPKTRKPWDPEQYRMAMFEAASYALAFYWSHGM